VLRAYEAVEVGADLHLVGADDFCVVGGRNESGFSAKAASRSDNFLYDFKYNESLTTKVSNILANGGGLAGAMWLHVRKPQVKYWMGLQFPWLPGRNAGGTFQACREKGIPILKYKTNYSSTNPAFYSGLILPLVVKTVPQIRALMASTVANWIDEFAEAVPPAWLNLDGPETEIDNRMSISIDSALTEAIKNQTKAAAAGTFNLPSTR